MCDALATVAAATAVTTVATFTATSAPIAANTSSITNTAAVALHTMCLYLYEKLSVDKMFRHKNVYI